MKPVSQPSDSTHQPARNLEDIKRLFALKRPCKDCPFRRDVQGYLGEARIESIIQGHQEGVPFFCHKTTTQTGFKTTDRRARYCAGYQLMSVALDHLPSTSRLGIAYGLWSPDELARDVEVVESYDELRTQHCGGEE